MILVKCRQPVLIECPRSYEPRALPLRHAGEMEWNGMELLRL